MHQYRVLGRLGDSELCALQCSNGRFHLARALNVPPSRGTLLRGDKPHLGFGILLCAMTGAIFRVIFESINDPTPASPLDLKHGAMPGSSPDKAVRGGEGD